MALTRVTSGGIAEGVVIRFSGNGTPQYKVPGSPAISFENDTDTGIYNPNPNELAITTGGETRLIFKSDGQILTGNNTSLGGTNPDFVGATNIVLYVNQSDKNATDAENNDGGNINRPFKTIERALLEAARKSYRAGLADRFEAYTIMVLPGDYTIDNRPGIDYASGAAVVNPLTVSAPEGAVGTAEATATTGNLETGSAWRFNPRNGGVIVPRGTSIVGYDLRKTVIRPRYVPTPGFDDGSITGDTFLTGNAIGTSNYKISGVMYDAANMIEEARSYIVEQSWFAAMQAAGAGVKVNETCKRDIGYIVDAVIRDLREGGNANSYVAGEFYTNGVSYNYISSSEVAATIAAFERARNIMLYAINNALPGSGNSTSGVPSGYSFTEISSVTFNSKTYNATAGIKPTYTAGIDYSTGSTYDSGCATAESAIVNLISIITGIIGNPDTYTRQFKKVAGVNEQTAIFKVTGGCYFWQMTFKDSKVIKKTVNGTEIDLYPLNSTSYNSSGIPTFTQSATTAYSHHRVVSFTYADQRTTDGDLDLYYKKIDAWDASFDGGGSRDVREEEYTIVGDVSTKQTIDTVNSASPYIFNCSLRSIYGLCGMHTDGSKVKENSFKSMVVAQFTGISLQKDPNAYWQPRNATGKVYADADRNTPFANGDTIRNIAYTTAGAPNIEPESATNIGPIYADPNAEFKHDWRHFHIKASEGAFIQVVSVFAVGYADQFLAVNGGDMSITNSNSNFGHISLRAVGNKFKSDPPSAYGKITALIPPAGISTTSSYTEIYPISADTTWKANLGESAQKTEPSWKQAKVNFSTAGGNFFRLYLEIPGVQKEEDIPELVVESVDIGQNTTIVDSSLMTDAQRAAATSVKRFLTFGSNNNYNLFRDYYTSSGVLPASECKIANQVDTATGGVSTYEAIVSLTATNSDYIDSAPKNTTRQGYFWDPGRQKVYLKIDPDELVSRTYISNFVFSSVIETQFVTKTETLPDGSSQVVSTTEDVNVLEWWDSFPGSITSPKFVDSRGSNPNDLLWRVKYVIPKDYRDPNNLVLAPKPPEKRFVIKGTAAGTDGDGIPYTNYRFTVWDVQEVDTWQRDVRDGVYYLTVLRADVDKFIDGTGKDSLNNKDYRNLPVQIVRDDAYQTIFADTLSELNRNDNNYRVSSNVNYLYPSTNEEGNIYDPRIIWNPPQADSRCIVEPVVGNIAASTVANGFRAKDVSAPNKKYYNSSVSGTPFYEVPALTSITAEAVHRLVAALNLCYMTNTSTTPNQIKVAPVTSWDSRASFATKTVNGVASTKLFNIVSTATSGANPAINIYGDVGSNYRWGSGIKFNSTSTINFYGVAEGEEDRKIVCCYYNGAVQTDSTLQSNSKTNESTEVANYAPVVPLYRPSILRASSHTWEYIGIGPGNYSTGFPNLQTRVLKPYEQFIVQGYENAGGFVASSGTNSAGDFYIGNQVIQAGGQSTTTLNVPKVRKSSESNSVDFSDIENRIANNVINVIASTNKSSAQQNLLKGLSNFFTTARLTVSDRANIQTLYITDKMYIANTKILNGDKFPEGGPEGYGFVKGARPEKTGYIATDTNDRLYVSPKFLDAWRIKKKILSASNVNLDNNRIYLEPLSRTFTNSISGSIITALTIPTTFTGSIISATSTTATITLATGTYTNYGLYTGMKVAQRVSTGGTKWLYGEAVITAFPTNNTITIENVISSPATTQSGLTFYAIDTLKLLDTSGLPPFGRIDIQMSLEQVVAGDYYKQTGTTTKYYFNPTINISLQYDDIDYTNNTITLSTIQNYLSYYDYITSVLPNANVNDFHTIPRYYPPVLEKISSTTLATDTQYVSGNITGLLAHPTVTPIGLWSGSNASVIPSSIVQTPRNDELVRIGVDSTFYSKIPTRGAVTIRQLVSGNLTYTTFVYVKLSAYPNALVILRRVDTQSKSDSNPVVNYNPGDSNTKIFFTGCTCYASYGDKWTYETAFIPTVETITEDVDIESATLYTLPEKPVPYTDAISTTYTDSIVPNPVTSKALGANLQTKRAVKTFQPLETLAQAAAFAETSAFTAADTVELLLKPGYYRLDNGTTFPCQVKINGSGVASTTEKYAKEFAKTSAGRLGGYSLSTVKSGDSVNFFRSPTFINNYAGRTDLVYANTIGRNITTTGGLDLQNVHFLGLNEAITRNEILDNTYSTDTTTIIARRKIRKAWYVKKSRGFPSSSAGVEGGLAFHAIYDSLSSQPGKPKFSYTVNDDEMTDTSGVITAPDVDTKYVSKNARYMTITFNSSDFSSSQNLQYFNWMKDYVIPGTTLYYFHNQTTGTVDSTTRKTRVLDVKKTFSGTNLTSITCLVALYNASSGFTSKDEDLNISLPTYTKTGTLISAANDLTNGIYLVFTNRDGDEFVNLTYNWCLETRKGLMPKDFTYSGEGYDTTLYDVPEIYGIIAGYTRDTINLVVDINPSADYGGILSFGSLGVAPNTSPGSSGFASGLTHSNVLSSGGTGAFFSVTWTNNVYTVTCTDPGTGYKKGDVLTIPGNSTGINGATPQNDITITVGTITPAKQRYPGAGIMNKHPSITVRIGSTTSDYSVTIPTTPNGYLRQYGISSDRYYLLEVNAADIATVSDNNSLNGSILGGFSGFGFADLNGYGTNDGSTFTIDGVTYSQSRRRATVFNNRAEFDAVAKYNLYQAGGGQTGTAYGYYKTGSGLTTRGREVFINFSKDFRITRRKFPTASPPSIGNIGATLIKVNGVPGNTNQISLKDVTIGAISDSQDGTNTYGGGYYGGLIACNYGQIYTSGLRMRGNLVLDWSGLLSNGTARLNSTNKFGYGHCVDFIEPRETTIITGIGNNAYKKLNVSKDDINFNYYTTYAKENNMYVEPTFLPSGKRVDYDSRTLPLSTIASLPKFDTTSTTLNISQYAGNGTTTVTATLASGTTTSLGILEGNTIIIDNASGTQQAKLNGTWSILTVSTTTFTFLISQTLTSGTYNSNIGSAKLQQNNYKTSVILDEKYSSKKLVYASSGSQIDGYQLRFNNTTTAISAGTAGGHPDPNKTLAAKSLVFTLPYGTATEKLTAENIAKNIFPNFTNIVRYGNTDSVLATILTSSFYVETAGTLAGKAIFEITYNGNIEYDNRQKTDGIESNWTGFELQLLTLYIQSQRFNYLATLTTRYKKVASADVVNTAGSPVGTYSKVEIGYDSAQKKSVFAENKDVLITYVGDVSGIEFRNLNRTTPGIISFAKETGGAQPADEQLKALIETDAYGKIISLDIVSLGLKNNPTDTLFYGNSNGGYRLTIQSSARVRNVSSDLDYEMFDPGEVVAAPANNTFIVNNFIESDLTGIKSALQKAKSIIAPGNYIKYGDRYYKIAKNETNRPYLGIYQYINPSNIEDVRTSLVVRLEESTYNITYSNTLGAAYDNELITRFELFEDDNILRYWPDSGRLEIGQLELADFTKQYIDTFVGYRLQLDRSNTKYWPSYIHDWDGLDIVETVLAGDPTNPTQALPGISVGTPTATEIRLADPVDVTCSTYKRIKSIGYDERTTTDGTYFTASGIATTNRTYVDIHSSSTTINEDFQKFEIGQHISIPFRNLQHSFLRRNINNSTVDDFYGSYPKLYKFRVTEKVGNGGTANSANRKGDNLISGVIYNTKIARGDVATITNDTSGRIIIYSPSNISQLLNGLNPGTTGTSDNNVYSGTSDNKKTTYGITNYIDPLSVIQATKYVDTLYGVPLNGSRATGRGSFTSSGVTIAAGQTTFSVTTSNGNGLVPNLRVRHSTDGGTTFTTTVLNSECKIRNVTRTGTSSPYTYTITLTHAPSTSISADTLIFTNEEPIVLKIDHPLFNDIPVGTEFHIVPAFNNEGGTFTRFTQIYKSRIIDIEKDTTNNVIRLYLADPISYGASGDNLYTNQTALLHPDSRHFGFCSLNTGGWTFPRSGGSYYNSNAVKLSSSSDQVKLPNYANRINTGDILRYTYEASTVVQGISLSTVSSGRANNYIRVASLGVDQGDSLKSLIGKRSDYYGTKDIYKNSGTYTFTHKRYTDQYGDSTDDFTFRNTWTSAGGTFLTQYAKTISTGGTTNTGSSTLTVSDVTGIRVGDVITGTGIQNNTSVTLINGTTTNGQTGAGTITISQTTNSTILQNATATLYGISTRVNPLTSALSSIDPIVSYVKDGITYYIDYGVTPTAGTPTPELTAISMWTTQTAQWGAYYVSGGVLTQNNTDPIKQSLVLSGPKDKQGIRSRLSYGENAQFQIRVSGTGVPEAFYLIDGGTNYRVNDYIIIKGGAFNFNNPRYPADLYLYISKVDGNGRILSFQPKFRWSGNGPERIIDYDFAITGATWSATGSTVTITSNDHGFVVGEIVNLNFTASSGSVPTTTGYYGQYQITSVPDANTFTVANQGGGGVANNGAGITRTVDIGTGQFYYTTEAYSTGVTASVTFGGTSYSQVLTLPQGTNGINVGDTIWGIGAESYAKVLNVINSTQLNVDITTPNDSVADTITLNANDLNLLLQSGYVGNGTNLITVTYSGNNLFNTTQYIPDFLVISGGTGTEEAKLNGTWRVITATVSGANTTVTFKVNSIVATGTYTNVTTKKYRALVFTTFLPDETMYIENISGNDLYFKSRYTYNGANDNGVFRETLEYTVTYYGGFTAGEKLLFTTPKPTLKSVSGVITTVSTLDGDGYSTVTFDTTDNILYSNHPIKEDWLSVSDILVSHQNDLFANDGPVAQRFMHSEYGGDLQFTDFRIWNSYYRNGSENKGYGIYGSHGWVGNFGRSIDGARMIGLTSSGALSISWGRQRGNSIWQTAQPVRPAWTHYTTAGQDTTTILTTAFTPAFAYIWTYGPDTFYSSSVPQYMMENNQAITSNTQPNTIRHTNLNTDSIPLTQLTSEKYFSPIWYNGHYHWGGSGPLNYNCYRWSSTFDSLKNSRFRNLNKISFRFQDIKFRGLSTGGRWGDIRWGTGGNTRLQESMILNYAQNYALGAYDKSFFKRVANYKIKTIFSTTITATGGSTLSNNLTTLTFAAQTLPDTSNIPYYVDQEIEITGATPSTLNGLWRVAAVTGTSVSFYSDGNSAGTAVTAATITPVIKDIYFFDNAGTSIVNVYDGLTLTNGAGAIGSSSNSITAGKDYLVGSYGDTPGTDLSADVDFTPFGAPNNKVGTIFTATLNGAPTKKTTTQRYWIDVSGKISKGDAIYISTDSGTTFTFVGFAVEYVGPTAGRIRTNNPISAAITSATDVYILRPRGVKTIQFENSVTNRGTTLLTGENVLSSEMAGCNQYNLSFSINRRTYNTTPLLNTENTVRPIGNRWWWWGSEVAHLAVRPTFGDLSSFEWTPMNINITRFNKKVHLESTVTVNATTSTVGLDTVYI